jgi:hypothetical protein
VTRRQYSDYRQLLLPLDDDYFCRSCSCDGDHAAAL